MKSNNFNLGEELVFISKHHAASYAKDSDIVVSIYKGKNRASDSIAFAFRNKINDVISNDEKQYLVFALKKNRIYFQASDRKNGYAVTDKGLCRYMRASLRPEVIAPFKDFIGEYSLKYDDFHELYYIEKEAE